MELNLSGKTVIVTGGGSNIGRGIVLGFAKERSNVVIADIDEEQANKVAAEASSLGGNVMSVKCDVTDIESVTHMIKRTLDEFGEIDVLVNNVGWLMYNTFRRKPLAECDKEISLNIWSVVNCTKSVLDHMITRKYGKIINISSVAGLFGSRRVPIYSLSKGGIVAFTKSLAQEVGKYGINVNAICPSTTLPESQNHVGKLAMTKDTSPQASEFTPELIDMHTKLSPLGRIGKAEDIANAAVFLASDAASFITGEAIAVSGGFPML